MVEKLFNVHSSAPSFEAAHKFYYSCQLITEPAGSIFPQSSARALLSSCTSSAGPFYLTPLSSHSSALVKYIKEMSAFFKSAGSPGAGLPWDSPPSTPQRGTEPSLAEVKEPRSIPLKMCQVSRKQCPPDTENR